MTQYDVFNGDADGICALQQLRLHKPMQSTLVTGVKRDINLLKKVTASQTISKGDSITVLDISMDKNRTELEAILQKGIPVTYFDHHFAGDIPDHPQLDANIDTASDVCTGLLVNRALDNAYLAWAVTAAFGDNLHEAAKSAAAPLGLTATNLEYLEELGTLLNYNGYGGALEDLFFPPAELYQRVSPYADPLDFIEQDEAFLTLRKGFASDMQKATSIAPRLATSKCALFVFPEDRFSRRVSGVYSNQLARDNPDRAHALASSLPGGGYLISVRAPLSNKTGADDLCRQFETGGGRKAAAGINLLPESDLDQFSDAFERQFAG